MSRKKRRVTFRICQDRNCPLHRTHSRHGHFFTRNGQMPILHPVRTIAEAEELWNLFELSRMESEQTLEEISDSGLPIIG